MLETNISSLKKLARISPDDIEKFVESFVGGEVGIYEYWRSEILLNDIDVNVIALHKFLCKSANKRTEFLVE